MIKLKIDKKTISEAKNVTKIIEKEKSLRFNSLSRFFKETRNEILNDAYLDSASKLKVSAKFKNFFKMQVYDKDKNKAPGAIYNARREWFALHEAGGILKPKRKRFLLIPFVKQIRTKNNPLSTIEKLRSMGTTFVKNDGKSLILYTNVTKENWSLLRNFRRVYKKTNNIKGALKQQNIGVMPLGVLVRESKFKKRTNFKETVSSNINKIFSKKYSEIYNREQKK